MNTKLINPVEGIRVSCDGMRKDLVSMSEELDLQSSFLGGNVNAVPPDPDSPFYDKTNPEFNGAWRNIDHFFWALKVVDYRDIPWDVIDSVFCDTFKYIAKMERLFPADEFEQAKTVVKITQNFLERLKSERITSASKKVCDSLEDQRGAWHKAFHGNSLAFYRRHNETMEMRRSSGEEYPLFDFTKYARSVVSECNRGSDIFGLFDGGRFFAKRTNEMVWVILGELIQNCDSRGFASLLKYPNWRAYFTTLRSAAVPEKLARQGVKSTRELSKHIVPEGKTGRFRLVGKLDF